MLCIKMRKGCDLFFIINMLFTRSHKNSDQQLVISTQEWLGHLRNPQAASVMSLTLHQGTGWISYPAKSFIPLSLTLCLLTHSPSVHVSVVKQNSNILFLLSSTKHSIQKTNVELKGIASTVLPEFLPPRYTVVINSLLLYPCPTFSPNQHASGIPYIRMTNTLCYGITNLICPSVQLKCK